MPRPVGTNARRAVREDEDSPLERRVQPRLLESATRTRVISEHDDASADLDEVIDALRLPRRLLS